MKKIHKTTPPDSFITYCVNNPNETYNHLSGNVKKDLKNRLLEDQGYICCYCGKRLGNDSSSIIEHVLPQSENTDKTMSFQNMLVCCDGGDADRHNNNLIRRANHGLSVDQQKPLILKHPEHCGAAKKNKKLPFSPLDDCEKRYTYFDDGTIIANDAPLSIINESERQEFYQQSLDVLNILKLNIPFLCNIRRAAIAKYDYKTPVNWSEELKKLSFKNSEGKYKEYCFVLESYIKIYHKKELTQET